MICDAKIYITVLIYLIQTLKGDLVRTMDSIEYTREDRIAFLKKLNAAREDVQKCDWLKDKFLSYGGKNGYRYISVDKMKANLAPVLQRHGLEWGVEFHDLEKADSLQSLSQHWIVRLTVSLIDIDTGYSTEDVVIGEAGDSLDKGVTKAETYALKTWLATKFMIADGMDPDAEDSGVPTVPFKPKTPAEQTQIVSKALNAGVAPKVEPPKTEGPKIPEAPKMEAPKVPTPQAPAPKVAEAPKVPAPTLAPGVPKVETERPKKRLKKDAEPAEKPAEEAVGIEALKKQKIQNYMENLTVIKKNMLQKKLENYSKAGQQGLITPEKAEEFGARYASIGSDAEFTKFIADFPEIQVDE